MNRLNQGYYFVRNIEIRIWLSILAIVSLFTGISLNGQWSFVHQYMFFFFRSSDIMYKDIVNHDQLELRFLIYWSVAFFRKLLYYFFQLFIIK